MSLTLAFSLAALLAADTSEYDTDGPESGATSKDEQQAAAIQSDFDRLNEAFKNNDLDAFEKLLAEGVNPLAVNNSQESILLSVLFTDNVDFAKALLAVIPDEKLSLTFDMLGTSDSLLLVSIASVQINGGNSEIVTMLVERGCILVSSFEVLRYASIAWLLPLDVQTQIWAGIPIAVKSDSKAICDLILSNPGDSNPQIQKWLLSYPENILASFCLASNAGSLSATSPAKDFGPTAEFYFSQGATTTLAAFQLLADAKDASVFGAFWATVPVEERAQLLASSCSPLESLIVPALKSVPSLANIRFLLDQGLSFEQLTHQGMNVIQAAFAFGSAEAARFVWDQASKEKQVEALSAEQSLLSLALGNYRGGGDELAQFVLDLGVKLGGPADVILSFRYQSLEFCQRLFNSLSEEDQLQFRSLVNEPDDTGLPPICRVLRNRQDVGVQLADYLINLGAKPVLECNGVHPLHEFAQRGSFETFDRAWKALSSSEQKEALNLKSVFDTDLIQCAIRNSIGNSDDQALKILDVLLKIVAQEEGSLSKIICYIEDAVRSGTEAICRVIWDYLTESQRKDYLLQNGWWLISAASVNDRDSDGIRRFMLSIGFIEST